MKTSYFILLVFLFSSCMTIKYVTAPKASEIIDVSGTKNDLYVSANLWMVRTFGSAKSVIQFQDKEAGKIMGRYLMRSFGVVIKGASAIDVYSLITISVKDNATRIDIEPLGNWPYNKSGYAYSSEMAQMDIKALINEYRKFISLKEDIWQKPSLPISANKNEIPQKIVAPIDSKKKVVAPIETKKKPEKIAKTKNVKPVQKVNEVSR
ncbi:MAG: DUF4468 domain-containing protein [Bacteroidia bacterium]|nr:DUF4468 domain-containing protein [Bacteroidia bacterium]